MADLGRIAVKLTQSDTVVNIAEDPYSNTVDMTAADMEKTIKKSMEVSQEDVEIIVDPATGWRAVIPRRRYDGVDNYMDKTASAECMASPRILWKVNAYTGSSGGDVTTATGKGPVKDLIVNDEQDIKTPDLYTDDYEGPRWRTAYVEKTASDKGVSSALPGDTESDIPDAEGGIETKRASVLQTSIITDTWWAIETNSIDEDVKNKPFYIDIHPRVQKTEEQETFIMIRINTPTTNEEKDGSIDLLFKKGNLPVLYDWKIGVSAAAPASPAGGGGTPAATAFEVAKTDLPEETPELMWGENNRIGILPICGKLVISINGFDFVYTRPNPKASLEDSSTTSTGSAASASTTAGADESLTTSPFFIKTDAGIKVVGTNCVCLVNLSAMTFARGHCATGIPAGRGSDTVATEDLNGSTDGTEKEDNVKLFQVPRGEGAGTGPGSTATAVSTETASGIAAEKLKVDDTVETVSVGDPVADEVGSVTNGQIQLKKIDSATGSGKSYEMFMVAKDGNFGDTTAAAGATAAAGDNRKAMYPPAFFRMRGVVDPDDTYQLFDEVDLSDDLMEFSESLQAPDENHVKHTLDLVLYNDLGVHNDLLEKSRCIRIKFKWNDVDTDSAFDDEIMFTGVSLGGTRTETAGRETINIHCEDYMFLLDHTMIMNSPYYDGMDAYNVVFDLAKRAGIKSVDDTGTAAGDRYFVPSGYSYTSPVMRFAPRDDLLKIMLKVCSLGQKVISFDGDGILHFEDLQGGIAFPEPTDVTVSHTFYSDPSAADATDLNILIGEKQRESKLESTVNTIVIKTVDRGSSNPGSYGGAVIIVGDQAEPDEDLLPFKRIAYIQQPAYGSLDAAMEAMNLFKKRMYKPALGITIKTVSDVFIRPLDFIDVDGEKYRIQSISRNYSAEENSLMTTIQGIWKGEQ
jgi:hypothetical protein